MHEWTAVDGAARAHGKKLKDGGFAAAVGRDDIRPGVAGLGVDETEHVRTCVEAVVAERTRPGL
jgi:predicted hydrolase (HD superfamily)